MSKVAKGLLVGFVLVACASGAVGDGDLGQSERALSGDASASRKADGDPKSKPPRPSANLPSTVPSDTSARLSDRKSVV